MTSVSMSWASMIGAVAFAVAERLEAFEQRVDAADHEELAVGGQGSDEEVERDRVGYALSMESGGHRQLVEVGERAVPPGGRHGAGPRPSDQRHGGCAQLRLRSLAVTGCAVHRSDGLPEHRGLETERGGVERRLL